MDAVCFTANRGEIGKQTRKSARKKAVEKIILKDRYSEKTSEELYEHRTIVNLMC